MIVLWLCKLNVRAMLRVDTGFAMGIILAATKLLTEDPCPFGSPDVFPVAHILVSIVFDYLRWSETETHRPSSEPLNGLQVASDDGCSEPEKKLLQDRDGFVLEGS